MKPHPVTVASATSESSLHSTISIAPTFTATCPRPVAWAEMSSELAFASHAVEMKRSAETVCNAETAIGGP